MKLVTTLAALEVLGPAYSWKTRYYLKGELANQQLAGDLIIQGGGDPYLVLEQFWRHLMGLQDRGLVVINGNLGIDNSRFAQTKYDPGKFDNSPHRLYNVGVSATLINFNASRFLFLPDGESVRVISEPALPNLIIDNQLKLGNKRCTNRENGWSHQIKEKNHQVIVRFDGQYSNRCGEFEWRRSVLSPNDYTYGTFKTTWEQLGGSLKGQGKTAEVGRDQQPFFVGGSKTLAEVISGTNKYSNNIMARQLLLTLGMDNNAASAKPATAQAGVARIRKWLANNKALMPELVIDNGAGLSRKIQISAASLIKLLQLGWQSDYQPEFMASLSIAAVDGTTRKRLKKLNPNGRIRAKTGYLKAIRSIAGYVKGDSGTQYAVSLLIEDPKIQFWSGNGIQDVLLAWVLKQ